MKRGIAALGFFAVLAFAIASAPMKKTLIDAYALKADSPAAKCTSCHTSGAKLNKYGKDLKTAMGASKTLTVAMVKSIDGKDSDADGKANGAEIKAGTNPGG